MHTHIHEIHHTNLEFSAYQKNIANVSTSIFKTIFFDKCGFISKYVIFLELQHLHAYMVAPRVSKEPFVKAADSINLQYADISLEIQFIPFMLRNSRIKCLHSKFDNSPVNLLEKYIPCVATHLLFRGAYRKVYIHRWMYVVLE